MIVHNVILASNPKERQLQHALLKTARLVKLQIKMELLLYKMVASTAQLVSIH